MKTDKIIKIGSRGSKLALWQANWVKSELAKIHKNIIFEIVIIKTKGDKILDSPLSKIGDKGLFTKEIEKALLNNEVDLAVHSLKDLPTGMQKGLSIGAISKRGNAQDVFVGKHNITLDKIEEGAVIATGSLRRKSQLLHYRSDFNIVDIRGNVQTRLKKLDKSDYTGMIMAGVGLERMGLEDRITQYIPFNVMLPAVGQGALGVEVREDDEEIQDLIKCINDEESSITTGAERAMLKRLEGGCQIPIGALGTVNNNKLILEGIVASIDGKKSIRDEVTGELGEWESLGNKLAEILLENGGREILDSIRKEN